MSDGSRPLRIWYQSFVHPVEQAAYMTRLQALLDAVASPGVRFEVHGLDPPDRYFHPLTELRCATQVIRLALEAERAGYDAFVIGHFQEPGLLEIRGAVEIPVIGLGEATLLAGLTMGRKIGLVTIDPSFIDWHERQVRAHALDARIAGIHALHMSLPRFMKAFSEEAAYAEVRAEFSEQVRPLVAAGAEIIVPAGGLPMLLFSRRDAIPDRRRTRTERYRRGRQGNGDGPGAEAPHRHGGEPTRCLCQGIAGGPSGVHERTLVS